MRLRSLYGLIFLLFFSLPSPAQITKAEYLNYIKRAAERGVNELPQVIESWKKTTKPSELWGYDGPGHPVYLADLLGYLYQETKEKKYAEQARDILVSYGDLRDVMKDYQSKRIEYRDGIPAIANFFIMPPYSRSYMRIRESGVVDAKSRAKIEKDLAFSLDHIFYFPEWGAHNRAMLRAESLYYGAVALPNHPHAQRWKQLAETLASDSLRQWEIEDATGYHGIWLYSVFSYADISRQAEVLMSPMIKYYLDYFIQLLTPHGNLADFGDAHWNDGNSLRFVPVYERAAALYHNPQYKYFAQELIRRTAERLAKMQNISVEQVNLGVGNGSALTDACRWGDDTIPAKPPINLSGDVLDDLIGKKVVFRSGWNRTDTMMLLNYRDEGDGGWLGRDYLRNNLSVEEEKMHHGHADENSIALLMNNGSVLLHDGGYRPDLPSGPNGEWRADYFHNRIVARKNKRGKNQELLDFIHNSGAYRKVRTQKIDFQKFRDVDYSRTRLIDEELGYQWDRVITWVREQNYFIVIDGIKALRSDWFTFTNLWHTRKIFSQDAASFDTGYDQIQTDILPDNDSLLIQFPENNFGKQIGTFRETRHFQDEFGIYQTISSFYKSWDTEFFVTLLVPHRKAENGRQQLSKFRLLIPEKSGQGIGLEITEGNQKSILGVKIDLDLDLARENVRPRNQYELGKVKYGELESDAGYIFAKIQDQKISYSATTMTKIFYRQKTIMEALPTTFGLQLDGAAPRFGLAKWRKWEETVELK